MKCWKLGGGCLVCCIVLVVVFVGFWFWWLFVLSVWLVFVSRLRDGLLIQLPFRP